MIFPSKYENLRSTSLLTGAAILQFLMDHEEIDIKLLLDKFSDISISSLVDTLTFLFIIGFIELNDNKIRLIHDTKKT